MDILGVHGVGNYDESASDDDRVTAWSGHLRSGFGAGPVPEFDLAVAYYAPALHLARRQGEGVLDDLSDDEQRAVWAWLEAQGLPEAAIQGRGTKPLRQWLEWFARKFDLDSRLAEKFVMRFFPEVCTYLDPRHADLRAQARQIVAQAIEDHQPQVILAHSLGSIVTYEVLWQNPEQQVDLLVTLGSPLAMPTVVYDRLDPSPRDRPARKPPGVARWVNIADPGDVVSILRPIGRYFEGVDQDLDPSIHVADCHFARHYLSSPTLAAVIGGEMAHSSD